MAIENGVSESDGINEISRLLLQGWTMLADVCPRVGCHMPLLRSRQGRVLCCTCRADIVTAAAPSSSTRDASANANPASSEMPPTIQTYKNGDAPAQASVGTLSSETSPTIQTNKNADAPAQASTVCEREDGDSASRSQDSKETGVVSTHVAQAFSKSHDSTSQPGSSNSPDNVNVDNTTERAVVPVNVSTSSARELEHIGGALDRRLLAGWTLTREACAACGAALLRNALDGRVECVTCGRPTNSELTTGENRTTSREVDVVRASNGVQIARQNRDGRRTTSMIVPSTGREPHRAPVASSGHAQRAGVGVELGGSGGMLDMGSSAGGGLGTRRIGGRAAVGEVPTLEPRPTAANADPSEFMGDVEVDVDRELLLAEISAARVLRDLRWALADASDAETIGTYTSGIVNAADAINATRRARQARARVRTIN